MSLLLAFNCSSDDSSSEDTGESCATPRSLHLYELESCSFKINWNGNGETAWQIEYGEVGFTIGNGTVINTSGTYVPLTENIIPNTSYEVYVRAFCGSDGYSPYTETLVVTTNQIDTEYVGDWTIEMADSYGDGWQGDGIKITVNDVITYATISPGTNQFSNTQTVNVPSTTSILIFEFTGDEYADEVSYQLISPNGVIQNSDSNPPVGVIFSMEDICN